MFVYSTLEEIWQEHVVGNKLIFDVEEEEAIDSAQLKAIITDKQYNLMY